MKKGLLLGLFTLIGICISYAQSTDGMQLVFEDDFSNNKNAWQLNQTGNKSSFINYDNKLLVLDTNVPGDKHRVTMNAPIGFNQDFVLKTSLKCKECAGAKDVQFGILFGMASKSDIDSQGYYSMRLLQVGGKDEVWIRVNNSNGTQLYDMNAKSSFDPNDFNELSVERTGDTVNFYVNGSLVYSNTTTETTGNQIALLADNKMKIFMQSISMWTK